jgi:predicted amidophosphoribosyltransferase
MKNNDACPSRDDAQPHIFESGRCVLCLTPRFDPEQCRECGAPFNDADAPSHGLCPACYA